MTTIEYKDFVQVCGILQMANDDSARKELASHYKDLLDKPKEEREEMQKQLLKKIKPTVIKLYKLIEEV